MVFFLYATITQYTSSYKYIWMTGYSDWNIIVDTTYNMFIIRPIAKIISFPPSNTVGVMSVLL